jgi:arylsulfatase A-like enzyme
MSALFSTVTPGLHGSRHLNAPNLGEPIMKGILRRLSFYGCLILAGLPPSPLHATPAVDAAAADRIFTNGFEQPPNILLVIMDDVGVDQIASFGYGGARPPSVPTIDAIADSGLRFRNAWSMPECSPGRSTLLTGRYPLRSNVNQALGPNDLANSQVSPYEVTVPRLLDNAGYQSGKFGKTHIGGPENNQAGHGVIGQLGWERFHGWVEGVPASIDTTAGGVAAPGTYTCGFVPNKTQDSLHGADSGACYTQSPTGISCSLISGNNATGDPPGLQCLTQGGILVPDATCQSPAPAHLDWNRQNAHYVSALVINEGDAVEQAPVSDPRGRGYRATLEVDAASAWIREQQQSGKPWMATLSFSNAHTPMQHPPSALLPSGISADLLADCTKARPLNMRRLYDAMIESLDTELGRLMVEIGLATRNPDGSLAYDPTATDTLIVVVGDNGSFYSTVKVPFDATRSKGTAYQTGVWVPLVVAGPMVEQPGRTVEHMVNMVDLYRLFGEVAGLDTPSLVPRIVDSAPMLPYLTHANQPSIRSFNFTEGGLNIQANGGRNGPCVISGQCSHTPMTRAICEDNNGTWWGEGADAEGVIKGNLEHCWQVNQAIFHSNPNSYAANKVDMGPLDYRAIRNEHYKLVRNTAFDYDPATDTGVEVISEELYLVTQSVPVPLLDRADSDLLADGKITPIQAINYAQLVQAMDALHDSKIACPGDGNDDGRVDQTDIDNYLSIVAAWSGSSVYDFNLDGITDAADLQILKANLGTVCFTISP